MSWLKDTLFGTKSSTKQYSTLSASQQGIEKQVAGQLSEQLKKGLPAYPGQLTAAMPQLVSQAGNWFNDFMRQYQGSMSGAMAGQIAGVPGYAFDPAGASRQWKELYATPLMETWGQTVRPMIEEQYNMPGVAYSASRGRGVQQQAENFLGQQLAPTLFNWLQQGEMLGAQSKEAALARQQAALQLPFMQYGNMLSGAAQLMALQQPGLSAQYSEWLRTQPQAGQQNALAYLGIPTVATVYQPGTSGMLQSALTQTVGGLANSASSWATGGGLQSALSSLGSMKPPASSFADTMDWMNQNATAWNMF